MIICITVTYVILNFILWSHRNVFKREREYSSFNSPYAYYFFKLKEEKKKDSRALPGNIQDECLVLCSTRI